MTMQSQTLPEIPGYASVSGMFARASLALEPPERVSVTEAAERHMILNNPGGGYSGPFDASRMPLVCRPADCLASGEYSTVAVMGPAQTVKSTIGNMWLTYTVIYDPANMLILGPDKQIMRDYMVSEIDPIIHNSRDLRARLKLHRSADNIFSKQFMGCTIFVIWPVGSQFRARPVPRARVDDYDDVPQDIGGQGDALSLLSGRQTTFEGAEMTYVNSSPALGTDAGIEALVATGTDERFYWQCPVCFEYFSPDFERDLHFNREGSEIEARESAVMGCPECGGVIEQRQKRQIQAGGVWLGGGQSIDNDGTITGELKRTPVASFRIDGLLGFSSFGKLAELWRTAELAFERRQDEAKLRAFFNTRGGKNYLSKVDGASPLKVEDIEARQTDYSLGTVPAGVRVLTAAVDIQANRFAVMVVGWRSGLESCVVDRFDIMQLADGRTKINPAQYAEHWAEILRRVIWARYPTADDPQISLPILNTGIDSGGIEGVSDNAKKFWHMTIKAGVRRSSITLIKGGNQPRGHLLPAATYLERKGRGKGVGSPNKKGAVLFVPNVHQFKDTLFTRLRREQPGPGYINLPSDFDPQYLAELLAEEKDEKGLYQKTGPNETLDLYVYNMVALIRPPWAGERSDLDWVPIWARPDAIADTVGDIFADERRSPDEDQTPSDPNALPVAPPSARRKKRRRGVRGGVSV